MNFVWWYLFQIQIMTFSCISSEYMRESHDLHTHMKQSAVIDRLQIWIGKGDQLLEYGSSLPWVASVISHTCLSSICIFYLYNYVLGLNLMFLINCSCWVQIWSWGSLVIVVNIDIGYLGSMLLAIDWIEFPILLLFC